MKQLKVEKQPPAPQLPPVQDSQSDLFPKISSSVSQTTDICIHIIYHFLLLYMVHSLQAASLSPSQKGIQLRSSVSGADNTTVTHVDQVPSPAASDTTADKHEHQDRDQNLLSADLTMENYKKKFHQLLCREEEEHEKTLEVK